MSASLRACHFVRFSLDNPVLYSFKTTEMIARGNLMLVSVMPRFVLVAEKTLYLFIAVFSSSYGSYDNVIVALIDNNIPATKILSKGDTHGDMTPSSVI